jgi:hypothetical protein
MALCIHYLWMEEVASRYWEWWLQMYWRTGCRQLTGLSIILGLDATNLFNILHRASDLDIFIGKACYTVLWRCIHPWMGLQAGESDCLGFHVQCVDESACSVQNTIIIYRTRYYLESAQHVSFTAPYDYCTIHGCLTHESSCLIIWYFTGEVTEIYTVQLHLEKVVPRSGNCKLNMMTRC